MRRRIALGISVLCSAFLLNIIVWGLGYLVGEATAQIPDSAIVSTTNKFLDYGLAGAIIVVLLAFGFFSLKMLISCLHASIERQTALVTVVQEQKSAGEKAADAMEALGYRIASMEKTIESMQRQLERLTVPR